jgi:hypothetical protein
VAISEVSPYNVYGVSATYLTPARSSYQAVNTKESLSPKPYEIELSHAAQARSLKSQGFSVLSISSKIGMSVSTIHQYLGITGASAQTATRTTYVEPKESKYKVELSGAALARSLRQEGLSVLMISSQMRLDVKTIKGYLGISVTA